MQGKMMKTGLFIVIVLCVCLSIAGVPEQAWSFSVIYAGRNTVDLEIEGNAGSSRCDSESERCDLYRDGEFIKRWENQAGTLYLRDDTVTAGTHHYQMRYYNKNGSGNWVDANPAASEALEVNTLYVKGTIHNNSEWMTKYGRPMVVWDSTHGPYTITDNVTVADGQLMIAENTEVVFQHGALLINGTGTLAAEKAVFRKDAQNTGVAYIEIQYQNNPVNPSLKQCRLSDIMVTLADCAGVKIQGNVFVKSSITMRGTGTGNLIEQNTGGFSISDASGSINTTIRNNVFTSADLIAEGHLLEGNECDFIRPGRKNNVIRGNRVGNISIIENGTGHQVIENTVGGINAESSTSTFRGNIATGNINVTGNGNTIEGNQLENGGIQLGIASSGQLSQNNVIRKNNIFRALSYGIQLYSASDNTVEYNSIGMSGTGSANSAGIWLSDQANGYASEGSSRNTIISNHIWGSKYGIGLHRAYDGNNGNGIHENIIENNSLYGILVNAGNNNNSFYNNIIRGNVTGNAQDNGTGNTWNTTPAPVNRNIVGGPWLGGNYWGDYTGSDTTGDQIGEAPYPILNATGGTAANDLYPLKPAIAPDPDIAVDRSSIDFGVIASGETSPPQTVTISNNGAVELVLGQILIGGTDPLSFAIQNDACSGAGVAPAGACSLEAIFKPAAAGAKSAKLVIPSNDPGAPRSEVALSGGTCSLNVQKTGFGTGSVASAPAGIDCGSDCREAYGSGTSVLLTAAPAADANFTGWTGDCSGTQNTCTITMDGSRTVTAGFALKGDINNDGAVTFADAITALQLLSGLSPAGTVSREAGVDSDGKIGLSEVIYILQRAAAVR